MSPSRHINVHSLHNVLIWKVWNGLDSELMSFLELFIVLPWYNGNAECILNCESASRPSRGLLQAQGNFAVTLTAATPQLWCSCYWHLLFWPRSCVERRSKENTSMIKWTAPVATRLLPSPRCPGWRIRKTNAAAFSPLAPSLWAARRVCSLGWLWSPSSGHSARPWLWQHRIWQINFSHFTNNRCVNWKIQHNRDRN